MKKQQMEQLIKKALKKFKIKGAEIAYMNGCTCEGDYSTYREGYGITIKGDEYDARDLKWKLKKEFENCGEELDFSYGPQTMDSDWNHDLEEESWCYSHVIIMLPRYHGFEKD